MNLLKQSTACTVKMGPFVNSGDGDSDETGLTIQKADVRLSKNGGNMAACATDQGASDAGAAHDEIGYYDISLGTGDTDTLGRLKVMIHKSGALHVWEEFQVVTANVYDTLCSTDSFDVNVTAISGDTTAANNLEAACDGTGYNIGGGDVVAASVTAGVTLGNDAITAAKYDQSTAFPLTAADGSDLTACATATGFSTHDAAAVKTAIEAAGSHLTLIKAKTDNLPANTATLLGTPAGASLADDIATLVAAVITNAAGTDVSADVAACKAILDILKTIVANKSSENESGTIVTYRNDADNADAGSQSWTEATKTRGAYTPA